MPAAKTKTTSTKTGVKKTIKTGVKQSSVTKVAPMNGKKNLAAIKSDLKTLPLIPREFISSESVSKYHYCFGNVVASSFAGFLAGIVVTSLTWLVIINVFFVQ